MKKTLLFLTFLLGIALHSWAFDFRAQGNSGLYCFFDRLTSNTVAIVSWYSESPWNPSNASSQNGDIVLPTRVYYDNDYQWYDVVAIGPHAYANCLNLNSVTIPTSITSIDSTAFQGCTGLTHVIFDATNCTSMGDVNHPLFSTCTALTTITIGADVQTVPAYAFSNIPNLTTINYNATSASSIPSSIFSGSTSITTINFEENIQTIKLSANTFSGCTNPITINYNATNCTTANYYLNGCTAPITVNFSSNVQKIAAYAFSYGIGLTSVTIPNHITSIGDGAFRYTGLTSITIHSDITSIGIGAFASCASLTTVNYNATNCSIPALGVRIFSNCTAPATLNIGANVQTIPYKAFSDFTGLTTVNYNATNCTSMGSVFSSCTHNATLNIGGNVTQIPKYAFKDFTGLRGTITFPNSVTRIYDSAFCGCTGIHTLTFHTGTSSNNIWLYKGAFQNCTGLTVVNLNAREIGGSYPSGTYPFSGCTSHATLNIGENVRKLKNSCFANFTGLSGTLIIPDNVTHIGSASTSSNGGGIFYNCRNITSLIIGSSVAEIGYLSFGNCTGLTEIHSRNSVAPTLTHSSYTSERSFYGVPSNIPVYIPCGSLQSYQDEWAAYSNLTNFIEESGVTFNAVSNNNAMGSVHIDSYPGCTNSLATVSANANDGYVFDHWSDGSTDNPHTFSVTSGMTITAYFGIAATVTVTSDNTTMGTASGSGTYAIGGTATISAEPNTGYHFTQWNDGNTDNPRTIDVASDTNFTAFFEINHYTVNVVSNNTELGSVTGGGTFDHGTTITISAEVIAENHHFAQWQDGDTDNPRTITVTSDITYTAYFAIDEYSITAVSGNTTMGTTSGSGSYAIGSTATISANANFGYHFTQWNDSDTDNPRTVTVTGNAYYTAYFEPNQYTITVISGNTEMGSVSGSGTFDYGTSVTISAEAVAGHHFTQWNDGNTQNPRTVTVTGVTTYIANFETTLYTITVLSDDPSLGTVTGGGTYPEGRTITISAQPAGENCHFSQWQDGNRDNPRTITVTGNAEYVAHFVDAVGIDEVTTADGMKIYTRGNTIVIDFSGQQAADGRQSVVVYDVMGRVIKQVADSGQQAAVEIPVTSAGVYMVKVGEQPSRKVIIRP